VDDKKSHPLSNQGGADENFLPALPKKQRPKLATRDMGRHYATHKRRKMQRIKNLIGAIIAFPIRIFFAVLHRPKAREDAIKPYKLEGRDEGPLPPWMV
jgi:hypothetical protein